MRDLHVHVVDANREIISRAAVRAGDDKVVELGVFERYAALDKIIDDHASRKWILEAHHRLHPGWWRGLAFAATPVVAWLLFACKLLGTHGIEFFLRTVAVIGLARVQQLLEDFPISLHPGGLIERPFVILKT